jgi:hypothetical protein
MDPDPLASTETITLMRRFSARRYESNFWTLRAPERIRKTTWKDQIVATDFFTVEVWTCSGLTRFVVLFFMDLSTRRVEIGGIASSANGLWMSQIARNLTDAIDGFFSGKRYLIHDRDPLYTKEFLGILRWSWHSIR